MPDSKDFFNFNDEKQDFFENHVTQFLMQLEVRLFILYYHAALYNLFLFVCHFVALIIFSNI